MNFRKLINKAVGFSGYKIVNANPPILEQKLRQIKAGDFFDLYFSLINPEDFFLVQLGANDGSFVDPVSKYIKKRNLPSLLVEPQKDVFESLKKNYKTCSNVQFCNCAISDSDGEQHLYTISEKWRETDFFIRGTAIAAFDKASFITSLKREINSSNNEKLKKANIEDVIQKIKVPTLTLSSLLKKYNVSKVDFLQIDCEGYDYEIIKMIDFDKICPKIINFESKRFTSQQRAECESMLEKNGYKIFRHHFDTCAFKTAL